MELTRQDWQNIKTQAESQLKDALINMHIWTENVKVAELKLKGFPPETMEEKAKKTLATKNLKKFPSA